MQQPQDLSSMKCTEVVNCHQPVFKFKSINFYWKFDTIRRTLEMPASIETKIIFMNSENVI